MPKLECPFVREETKRVGYVVIPKLNEQYRWIFDRNLVTAQEKLDGTNVSIVIENGIVKSVWNRKNRVQILTGDWRINEALLESAKKKYLNLLDGQHFGEVIGPNVNGNPYKLERHIWLPFETCVKERFTYNFWNKFLEDEIEGKNLTDEQLYEKVEVIFKNLWSLFHRKTHGTTEFAEGIVFYNKQTGEMCKIRRDMWKFFKRRSCYV